jgi:hypothetical protein
MRSGLKPRGVNTFYKPQDRTDRVEYESRLRFFQECVVVRETLIVTNMVELVENADRVFQNLLSHFAQVPLLNGTLDVLCPR